MHLSKNLKLNNVEFYCGIVYLVSCLYLSINPYFWSVWLVENITVWLLVILVVYVSVYHCRLSKISLILITIACVLHTIGGHYGFSNVPLGKHLVLFGEYGRNNFDRFGHLFCGALSYAILDVSVKKRIFSNKIMMYVFVFSAIVGIAGIYELLEWLDFIIAEKQHSELFLGNLVNPWDPHADMLNCCIGSILSMLGFAIVERKNLKL
ncbi:MAG: DUF2238 domain-containing protein [Lentisphaeria bacterium]|nr:DUF2238 domain-containing protein [Lentisphaeria bacterium]